MDVLKTQAPFWKREHLVDGSTGGWIEAKDVMAAPKPTEPVEKSTSSMSLVREG